MSDTRLDKLVTLGTSAARLVFTPDPPPDVLVLWFETDTGNLYAWGTTWFLVGNATVGTIPAGDYGDIIVGTNSAGAMTMVIDPAVSAAFTLPAGDYGDVIVGTNSAGAMTMVIDPVLLATFATLPINLATGVTGVLPVAHYATGTPTGSKFIRDDGVMAVPPGSGGTLPEGDYGDIIVYESSAGALTMIVDPMAPLPTGNVPLAIALASKADIIAPGSAITASGNLSHSAHANREIPATGAGGYTVDLRTDALGGWVTDDCIEIHNQTSSTITLAVTGGTLGVPTGYTATAGAGAVLSATREANLSNTWTSTTVAPAGSGTLPEGDYGDIVVYASSAGALTMVVDPSLLATLRKQVIAFACSDESTALTTGTNKVKLINPFSTAFNVTGVVASLSTAQTSGSIFTVDVNEAGTTILSTKLTIDNTETNSSTAATAAVISDSSIAAYAEIEVDIDQVGDGTAKGLKVYILGYPS